jgi:GT2 family glycosyltransferase
MEARTSFAFMVASWFTGVEMQPFLGIGCYVHHNRDVLVRQALENNCTHLLQVDTDMMFGHDAIKRLLAHDLDIVGARYNKRVLIDGQPQPTVKQDIKELSEVPFVPTGFLLVKTDVFKKIGKPWFSFNDGAESEDVYFCDKAIKHGYKVYCDPTIQVGHLGTAVF